MAGKYPLAERIVVKVGTGTLFQEADTNSGAMPALPGDQLDAICYDISQLGDTDVTLVSSGAIATAAYALCQPVPKSKYVRAQLAGIGQPVLMGKYIKAFKKYGKTCAQCLLTYDDMTDKRRRRNLRMVLDGYFRDGIIPIINENDAITTEEITFGDNDILAAMLAVYTDSDLLVMLSNPIKNLGSGGEKSKEAAKKILSEHNIPLEIINGRYEEKDDVWQPKIMTLF